MVPYGRRGDYQKGRHGAWGVALVSRPPRRLFARAYVACIIVLAVAALASWSVRFGFFFTPSVLALGLGLGLLCAAERAFPVSLGV